MRPLELIEPDWPAPSNVRAVVTTRHGGVSIGPYASLNLAQHTGDCRERVAANRQRLCEAIGVNAVCWLHQQHGIEVVAASAATVAATPAADAVFCHGDGPACAILSADCLPVLLCSRDGRTVAAAHCGWRGLANGVLAAVVAALTLDPGQLLAWLGPAIGPRRYEIGDDVRSALQARTDARGLTDVCRPSAPGKWLLDLYGVARAQLAALGITDVHGGDFCTYEERRFYSYRRDGVTGRMASLIWIRPD
jgi:YfiH family protein